MQTACRLGQSQVGKQRDLHAASARSAAHDNVLRVRGISDDCRRSTDALHSTYRARGVAPPKAKLRTDITSEAAGCSHHPGFNFHFLSLAVQLCEQAIDSRNHVGNIGDDQRVGALIRHHISALSQELLHRGNDVLGVRITQETRNRDFLYGQRLGFLLGATRIRFLLQRI